jgi:membrane associated rhomboid family serine protease
MRAGRLPLLTIAVLAATTTVTVLARTSQPGLADALRRNPGKLRDGQWWRLVSPALFQPDKPFLVAATFLLVAIVGVAFEWRFGRARWILFYLAGAISGHAAGHVFQPHGAGASVAGAGLLGGFVGWVLKRGPAPLRVGAVIWLAFAVVDTVLRDIHGVPILAGAALGLLLLPARSDERRGEVRQVCQPAR